MTRTAIVIGGGIGGLAAALALSRIGWHATVLEKVAEVGEVGAGLSLSPNAFRALDALGVGTAARAVSTPTEATANLRVPSGRYLTRAVAGQALPLRAFRRAALHRLLWDAVPDGWIRTGEEVTGVRHDGGTATVTVTHTSGETAADLVIAADGIRSTARRLVWPEAQGPRFLHYTAWLGLTDGDRLPPGEARTGSMTMGPRQYFLIHPLRSGQFYWALGAPAEQPGERTEDELARARARVAGWHDPVPALVDATRPEDLRRVDIHDLPPLRTFVHGNVVLLGDAAHAMSPDRGQGAGTSLEDSVVLAAALVGTDDIAAALARYDHERRRRTQSIARGARRTGQQTVNGGRLGHHLLTAALRATPSALWQRATAPDSNSVWSWTPPALPATAHGQ
ncbi:2-polyprenyl-6-methoxyphenol hydroxylase-like FAD-dependent oxidoreductase [Nocardia transvalensis]|uniref:2-polyprenyl-6-methoxyphenol hydroxylase-like FAD-dependent oxidoreductase n=1 Tax=Nocardia transvalensis TaxID=37333 RepID=A0A7W9UKN9_9NOCA|nr:FAD-dependent monooxygenase [Nocardia transvalensis]MBB5916758.1 2-polyprenyl-6-methoxyphenol hydroxylase-like FAD-dependent oxidoreductase [Nocardia transvalensis]